jgi:hypothetical protein
MRKLKIPLWATLKPSDLQWIAKSRLGWLYEKTYIDQNLLKIAYYYSKVSQQYDYYTEGPKLRSSKSFHLQRIFFGYHFSCSPIILSEKKSLELLGHWGVIHQCLNTLNQERPFIQSLLNSVLKNDAFPSSYHLHYWVPFFKKGLEAIGSGIK